MKMERGDKSRIWKKNLNSGKKAAFYALWKVRSGDAMKTQIAPLKKMIKLLNQLGDTTEDSYLLYDPKTDRFYFSSNILSIFDKFQDDTFSCSSEVWRSVVYPLDLEKFDTINQELVHQIRTSYNFNYRMEDPQGRIVWINSRGKSYFDEQEQSQYILGRISREVVFDVQNEGYRPTITKELSRLYAAGQEGYLLIVGIDNLRRINLRQGREFGDAVIGFLAEHIQIAAAGKAVFRINGDCFCVLLNHTDRIQVDAFFQRIQKDLKEQCSLSGGAVPLQTYKVSDGSILLEYAESALETAKLSGKSRLCFFSPSDYERKLDQLELLDELKKAIQNDFAGFSVCYQGQVCSECFKLYGAEALLRFESKRWGMVPPKKFISILEESDLIYPVGLWVIQSALEQCKSWREVLPDFHISVNMSYKQLLHGEIQGDVKRILEKTGLPGSAVTFELTESMELQSYVHLNVLFSQWKKLGIEISVDDFGTGYSSLSWLKELAVDEIKIDRCFIREIEKSAYNLRLLSNIIELANSCHMRVCCEGVETAEELTILEELHPSTYQGFFFSPPCQPALFAERYLRREDQLPETLTGHADISETGPWMLKNSLMNIPDLEHEIFESTEDMVAVIDWDTYEIYYLDPAGQRMFGVRDFRGRKCYKTFWGKDMPCKFCPKENLRHDTFYVWETWNSYCGNHFLVKDKLMDFKGKKLRLQIGMDITKREYVSQATRERVAFSQKIVGYVETLRSEMDYGQVVEQVLASVGDFYKADRAYLFERVSAGTAEWKNTYEWCAPKVVAQKNNLQALPQGTIQRWMELFEQNQSVIIYNVETLQKTWPLEYSLLQMQEIQRLIAVPVWVKNQITAFIGVDNPRYSIADDSQIRVLSAFLSEKLRTI